MAARQRVLQVGTKSAKKQFMNWKCSDSPIKKIFRIQQSVRDANLFYDINGFTTTGFLKKIQLSSIIPITKSLSKIHPIY